MKPLSFFQIDAFSESVFGGNPAAVVPLDHWLPDELLLKMAMEHNLSETAFTVPEGDGYRIRWFTPVAEVDLCGHATLATAHYYFSHAQYTEKSIRFYSRSGLLTVMNTSSGYQMDFPLDRLEEVNFDKVVFASSFLENERVPFLQFKDFVKHFVPEIHLVEIHTSSLLDPPYFLSHEAMEEFRSLCAPFRCETHIHRNFNVERGIRAFAEEVGARLIGISNHNRHPLKRMLAGSNVEALINHSSIPVLSIDYPN